MRDPIGYRRWAIAEGRLRDTFVADIIRSRAMVAVPDNPSFPPATRAFLLHNYVRVGSIRVAGMLLPAIGTLRIAMPATYALVSRHGRFTGMLDGTLYTAPRFLGAGVHTFRSIKPGGSALIWQRAAATGLSPFTPEPR